VEAIVLSHEIEEGPIMRTLLIATTALMLSAVPAHAQLLGGGLGGMIGGNIGIGGITGGVSGTVDATTRTAVRVPQPRVRGAVPSVATTIVVPAVPDVAVRRTAIIEAGIVPVPLIEVPAYVDHQYVILQEQLRGSGVEVIKRENQIVLEMPSDVTFAFDRYDIQPRFYGVLNAVSRTLARYPATYVDVYGHTDAIGSHSYNQRLSERRAGRVADFLAGRSVDPARMRVEGFGKTEPVASNATIAGRAANRRVEIVLTPYAS
jgi:outer membrane protein OmpA-like peptidoglycan-associated protein